jgi:Asp-tRNA(Asn)/Glu-tRNA(Gln) amidotransferase C subunit
MTDDNQIRFKAIEERLSKIEEWISGVSEVDRQRIDFMTHVQKVQAEEYLKKLGYKK